MKIGLKSRQTCLYIQIYGTNKPELVKIVCYNSVLAFLRGFHFSGTTKNGASFSMELVKIRDICFPVFLELFHDSSHC